MKSLFDQIVFNFYKKDIFVLETVFLFFKRPPKSLKLCVCLFTFLDYCFYFFPFLNDFF